MISGSIGKHGKFRLWRNVCHCSHYEISNDRATHGSCVDINNLVLEIMISRGARVLYGMLGVTYSPSETEAVGVDDLKSKINLFSENEDYLVKGLDSVCVGLPKNYANAVMDGFRRAFLDGVEVELSRLQIFYAAYGDISSSEQVFEKIGFVTANLIAGSCSGNFEESINCLLEGNSKRK